MNRRVLTSISKCWIQHSNRNSRLLSIQKGSSLELAREVEVKNVLRNVIDAASGKNVVSTGSLQVDS